MTTKQIPFLQKFAGKTSRLGKQGITALIQKTQLLQTNKISVLQISDQHRRRPSIYREYQKSQSHQTKLSYNNQISSFSPLPSQDINSRLQKKFYLPDLRNSNQNILNKNSYIPSFGPQVKKVTNNQNAISKGEINYSSVGRLGGQRQIYKVLKNSERIDSNRKKEVEGSLQFKNKRMSESELNNKGQKPILYSKLRFEQQGNKHYEFLSNLEKKVRRRF